MTWARCRDRHGVGRCCHSTSDFSVIGVLPMTRTFHLRSTGGSSFIRGLKGERRECARKTAGEGFAVGTTHQYETSDVAENSALSTRATLGSGKVRVKSMTPRRLSCSLPQLTLRPSRRKCRGTTGRSSGTKNGAHGAYLRKRTPLASDAATISASWRIVRGAALVDEPRSNSRSVGVSRERS